MCLTDPEKQVGSRRQRRRKKQASTQGNEPQQTVTQPSRPEQKTTLVSRSQQTPEQPSRSEQTTTPLSRSPQNPQQRSRPQETTKKSLHHEETAAKATESIQNTSQVPVPYDPIAADIRRLRAKALRSPFETAAPLPLLTTHSTPEMGQTLNPGYQLRPTRAVPIETLNPRLLASAPSEVSSYDEPTSPSQGRGKQAKVPKNSMGIGIETEFLVQARDPDRREGRASTFGESMAQLHNKQVPSTYPRMDSIVGHSTMSPSADFNTWTLMSDITVDTHQAPCK